MKDKFIWPNIFFFKPEIKKKNCQLHRKDDVQTKLSFYTAYRCQYSSVRKYIFVLVKIREQLSSNKNQIWWRYNKNLEAVKNGSSHTYKVKAGFIYVCVFNFIYLIFVRKQSQNERKALVVSVDWLICLYYNNVWWIWKLGV